MGSSLSEKRFSARRVYVRFLGYDLPQTSRLKVKGIVEKIEHLKEGIAKIDREIEERRSRLKGIENIRSIGGIGKKNGIILTFIIGDIHHFESGKKLLAYFGLVPWMNQSHDTHQQGQMIKQGNKLDRSIFVQWSLGSIRYSPYVRGFYKKIKAKKGAGKAIVASA